MSSLHVATILGSTVKGSCKGNCFSDILRYHENLLSALFGVHRRHIGCQHSGMKKNQHEMLRFNDTMIASTININTCFHNRSYPVFRSCFKLDMCPGSFMFFLFDAPGSGGCHCRVIFGFSHPNPPTWVSYDCWRGAWHSVPGIHPPHVSLSSATGTARSRSVITCITMLHHGHGNVEQGRHVSHLPLEPQITRSIDW